MNSDILRVCPRPSVRVQRAPSAMVRAAVGAARLSKLEDDLVGRLGRDDLEVLDRGHRHAPVEVERMTA